MVVQVLLSRVYLCANIGMQSLLISLVFAVSISRMDCQRARLRFCVFAREWLRCVSYSSTYVWTRSSRLSRYMSKIVGAWRHDDSSCRRAKDAGKVGPTLSNDRHTYRTCMRCHFRCACVSDGARKHLFIARIQIDWRFYGFQDAAGDRAVPRIFRAVVVDLEEATMMPSLAGSVRPRRELSSSVVGSVSYRFDCRSSPLIYFARLIYDRAP